MVCGEARWLMQLGNTYIGDLFEKPMLKLSYSVDTVRRDKQFIHTYMVHLFIHVQKLSRVQLILSTYKNLTNFKASRVSATKYKFLDTCTSIGMYYSIRMFNVCTVHTKSVLNA